MMEPYKKMVKSESNFDLTTNKQKRIPETRFNKIKFIWKIDISLHKTYKKYKFIFASLSAFLFQTNLKFTNRQELVYISEPLLPKICCLSDSMSVDNSCRVESLSK